MYIKNEKTNYIVLTLTCLLVAILIVLRDIMEISINKYLFVALSLIPAVFLNLKCMLVFTFFLMPLFNGVPSNYIKLILLLAIFFKTQKSSIKFIALIVTVCVALFETVHISSLSLLMDYAFWGVNLAFFVIVAIENTENIDFKNIALFYALSTIFAFVTILVVTINMDYIEDVLSGVYRFGDFSEIDLNYTKEMHLTLDPNYLGLYCLNGIIVVYLLLSKKFLNKVASIILIAMMIVLGILSLSRTFFICLLIFVFAVIFIEKTSMRNKMISAISIAVIIAVASIILTEFFPETIESLIRRLNDDSLSTGGGRTTLLVAYLDAFISDISYLLVGSGCIEMVQTLGISNDLHSAWVQLIVGFGLVGLVFVGVLIALISKQIISENKKNNVKTDNACKIFFVMNLIYFATLPVFANVGQLLPMLLSIVFLRMVPSNERKSNS